MSRHGSDHDTHRLADALRRVRVLEAKLREYEASFALYHKAIMRGTKRWQRAKRQSLVWPDSAKLIAWLVEELETKRRARPSWPDARRLIAWLVEQLEATR